MMRGQALYQGSLVSLIRFDHPSDRGHRDPSEEIAPHYCVSFIERGAFDLHQGRRHWQMGPTSLFITYPGFSYRCSHNGPVPEDVSFSVQYAPALVDDVQRTIGRRWTRSAPAARLTNRIAYLRHRLVQTASGADAAMAAPALAGELLVLLNDGAPGSSRHPARLFRSGQLAWYARRVDAAREMMTERFAEPLSLEATAREAGMSPFHFSRVFRELAGVPPHRYLLQVRLDHAARRLKQGAGVTETCHASGFNNLSHFTRTFRRAHGVSPSRFGV